MTNKPTLFRGPIVKIRRRTIKVKGRRLYTDSIRTVKMKVTSESLLLNNILYVLNLGANLLLSYRFYSNRKYLGIFNNNMM